MEANPEWYESSATVKDTQGIHMRPATDIMEEANRYKGRVELTHKDDRFDAKSVWTVLEKAIPYQSVVKVHVEKGNGDAECASKLVTIIEKNYSQ